MFNWLRKDKHANSNSPATKLVDPVCGMALEPGREAAVRTVGTRTVALCSQACVAKFDANPAKYLEQPGESPKGGCCH